MHYPLDRHHLLWTGNGACTSPQEGAVPMRWQLQVSAMDTPEIKVSLPART